MSARIEAEFFILNVYFDDSENYGTNISNRRY